MLENDILDQHAKPDACRHDMITRQMIANAQPELIGVVRIETFVCRHGEDGCIITSGRDHSMPFMMMKDQGLTATYNHFHDPEERDPGIGTLRQLHTAMDRAVLDAYGWTDIQPACKFILDYEEEEEENSGLRRRKKPWRYRWPDETRDEVLARLLELNRVRAEEEQLSGAAADAVAKSRANRQPRKGKKNMAIGTGNLLDNLPEEGKL